MMSATAKPSAPSHLYLATSNPHKVLEIQAFFQAQRMQPPSTTDIFQASRVVPEVACMPGWLPVDETADSFLGNASLKAHAACAFARSGPVAGSMSPDAWVLAEDAGFVVDVLAGTDGLPEFPGVRSNRWLTPLRYQALLGQPAPHPLDDLARCQAILALLAGAQNRRAAFVCALVAQHVASGALFETIGVLPLTVAQHLRGQGGFGYDPIVFPMVGEVADTRTVAELTSAEKNAISHRGQALTTLLAYWG